jgi:hypothetical protein
VATDVSVDGRERVVEKVDVGAGVDGTSEGDTSLLSSRLRTRRRLALQTRWQGEAR